MRRSLILLMATKVISMAAAVRTSDLTPKRGRTLSPKYRYLQAEVCRLVVRVPAYRSRGPGSIRGATIFYEK
jgi:hypothetical protein